MRVHDVIPDIPVSDIDAAYAEAKASGFEIVHPLTTEEWGVTRFFVCDPDGNVVTSDAGQRVRQQSHSADDVLAVLASSAQSSFSAHSGTLTERWPEMRRIEALEVLNELTAHLPVVVTCPATCRRSSASKVMAPC